MMSQQISAKDVAKLREITGAGMMDCKNALTESNGDMEAAIDYLRKKGQKVMDKRADRDANEGVCIALSNADRTKGIILNLCCETDFVSKNDDFVAFSKEVAELALSKFPASIEALNQLTLANGKTVYDACVERTGVIGEKIEVKRFETIEAAQVVPYIHMGYRAAVIVSLNKGGDEFLEAGKNVSMQIAAMKPIAVGKENVSQEVINREIEVRTEVLRNDPKNAGKPDEMLKKIVEGSLNKFFQEVTLLQQDYVKGNKETVAQYLETVSKGLTVLDFKHFALK